MEYRRPDFLHKTCSLLALCFSLLAMVAAGAARAEEWKTVDTTSDGIQVFQKEVSGSRLVAFRGVGTIEAPMLRVATLLFDTDRRQEWIEGLAESRILRWTGSTDFIEYDHIELPFFLRDRDFVSRISVSFDESGREMVFRYQPSEDPAAPRAGYVRGEVINARFILSDGENEGKTRVDVEFLCDPKGMIPKWLVNYFLKDWPKTTFRKLRKEAQKTDIPDDPRFSQLLAERAAGSRGELYRN